TADLDENVMVFHAALGHRRVEQNLPYHQSFILRQSKLLDQCITWWYELPTKTMVAVVFVITPIGIVHLGYKLLVVAFRHGLVLIRWCRNRCYRNRWCRQHPSLDTRLTLSYLFWACRSCGASHGNGQAGANERHNQGQGRRFEFGNKHDFDYSF